MFINYIFTWKKINTVVRRATNTSDSTQPLIWSQVKSN